MKTKLLFIYNADGNLFSKITDFAHKILSPSTYACNLCIITYDAFGMKKEWAEFLRELNIETIFFHKDEFLKKYGKQKAEFPAIYSEKGNLMEVIIPNAMIDACLSLEDLEQVITAKLKSQK